MRTSAAGLVGFAIGGVVGAVLIGQGLVGLPSIFGGQPTAVCNAVVRVSLDTLGKPYPVPDPVCLAKNRELIWEFDSTLEGGEVTIDFVKQDGYKGPFKDEPAYVNPHGNGPGVYLRHKGDKSSIHSNTALRSGQWTYSMTFTPMTAGAKPVTIDPVVCIRK